MDGKISAPHQKRNNICSAVSPLQTKMFSVAGSCYPVKGRFYFNELPQAIFLRFESPTKTILPYKMSAAGDFLKVLNHAKMILPYKMSAAGDFFFGLGALLRDFALQK